MVKAGGGGGGGGGGRLCSYLPAGVEGRVVVVQCCVLTATVREESSHSQLQSLPNTPAGRTVS